MNHWVIAHCPKMNRVLEIFRNCTLPISEERHWKSFAKNQKIKDFQVAIMIFLLEILLHSKIRVIIIFAPVIADLRI